MVPQKSQTYRTILNMFSPVALSPTQIVPSVNDYSIKTALCSAIDQIELSFHQIFMAKWNIKDSFWWLDCQSEEERDFSNVLLCLDTSAPTKLVILTGVNWIPTLKLPLM